MKHVVMFSGGIGSWAAAKRVAEEHGTDDVTLLFTDTLIEDADTYRFLEEAAENIGAPLVRIADGRTPWEVFSDVRFLGNTRVDPCSRILKRELADSWLEERYAPDSVTVYVGIDWSEEHRFTRLAKRKLPWIYKAPLCDPPLLTKDDMHAWAEAEGLEKQRLYKLNMPHANCFTGDTRFLTDVGAKSLRECAGASVRVLGKQAGWKDAEVRSFGKQRIVELRLQLRDDEKTIRTTADHRWFIRRSRRTKHERTTMELQPGDVLWSMHSKLLHNVRPSAIGVAHGIVFGDGSAHHGAATNNPASLRLCGDKDRVLLRFFPLQPTKGLDGGDTLVRDLPQHWKKPPPITESQSYLYGWLSGYFAADGSVSSGQAKLSSAERENLEFVRDVATRLGISTTPIRYYMREGFNDYETPLYSVSLHPTTLREDFFLIDKHRETFAARTSSRRPAEWRVAEVRPTDDVEEVFCAVVFAGHAFTLEDNIHTGNCSGGCIKMGQGGFARLYHADPCTYAEWEENEQRLRNQLGNVSILRDRSGGETTPLTLRELRERIENDGQVDMFDIGGCGCFVDSE